MAYLTTRRELIKRIGIGLPAGLLFGTGLLRAGALNAPLTAAAESRWNQEKIQLSRAWEITRGKADVAIGIVDTGVDAKHPEIAGRVGPGKDFTGGNDWGPGEWHGTFVAGIVAGESTGVAPNAKVRSLKVFQNNGGGASTVWLTEAVRWAANEGIPILNLSLGGGTESTDYRDAIDYAFSQGVLLICAAGNSGQQIANSRVVYPASHPHAFGVASLRWDDTVSYYSSRGPWVRLAAPGGDNTDATSKDPKNLVYGPTPGGNYQYAQGTSFASPHVAGTAALMLAANSGLKPAQVMDILMKSADPLGDGRPNETYGWGRLNTWRAVRAALPRDLQVQATPAGDAAAGDGRLALQGWVQDTKNPQRTLGDVVEAVEIWAGGKAGEGRQLCAASYGQAVPGCPFDDAGFRAAFAKSDLTSDAQTLWVGARTVLGDWGWTSISTATLGL